MNYALANARSLMPKIESLINYFDEYGLSFCVTTETWIQGNRENNRAINDLLDGSHIEMIRRDRGRRGGGVAISYDTRKAKLKKYVIPNNRFEIVCAVGKFNNNTRKVAIFAVYLPPKQTSTTTKEVEACIADCILKIKSESNDPLIIVAGDLNRKDISGAFVEAVDVKLHPPIPTRGTAALDLVFSNTEKHKETSLPPLSSDAGPSSDHNVLLVETKERHIHRYEKVLIRHRKMTDEGRKV